MTHPTRVSEISKNELNGWKRNDNELNNLISSMTGVLPSSSISSYKPLHSTHDNHLTYSNLCTYHRSSVRNTKKQSVICFSSKKGKPGFFDVILDYIEGIVLAFCSCLTVWLVVMLMIVKLLGYILMLNNNLVRNMQYWSNILIIMALYTFDFIVFFGKLDYIIRT